jgi:hypothetical protein
MCKVANEHATHSDGAEECALSQDGMVSIKCTEKKTIKILHKWSESFYAKKIHIYIYVQPNHYAT